jgi:type II secretory pathway component PulJ
MLEVVIAVSIILVFIANMFLSAQTPKSSSLELMKRQGYEALEYLDKTGELRYLAYSGNEVVLETRLEELLPSSISLDTDICTTSCTAAVPASVPVAAVEYYISGYRDAFLIKKVKLWMWSSF